MRLAVGQDFLRRMPEASQDLRRKYSLWRRLHIDVPLLLLLFATAAVGLIMLYSASDENFRYLQRQMVFFVLAFAVMWVVAQVNLYALARWSWLFYLGGVVLLVLVPFFGVGAKGAQRWLSLPGFRFQPSEIMKFALPIMVAAYLSKRHLPPRFKHILWALVFVAIPAVLIFQQPDFGTSILIALSGLSVLFLAGIGWRYIIGSGGLILVAAWPMWRFVLHDHMKARIVTFLSPELDKWGAGWNIMQSKTAIGSGGLLGKGWMQGTQSHLDFLPESHTDFIIAVLAEEHGLIGVAALIALYFAIVLRGAMIAMSAQDTFGRLMAGSITFTFVFYVFVNMGMAAGLLPVVGAPLPLISYGGTSLITLMMGFGLLMAISTQERRITV